MEGRDLEVADLSRSAFPQLRLHRAVFFRDTNYPKVGPIILLQA